MPKIGNAGPIEASHKVKSKAFSTPPLRTFREMRTERIISDVQITNFGVHVGHGFLAGPLRLLKTDIIGASAASERTLEHSDASIDGGQPQCRREFSAPGQLFIDPGCKSGNHARSWSFVGPSGGVPAVPEPERA